MFLDFEDYRPETPRIASAISRREGVLLSLLFHALLVIAWLVAPARQAPDAAAAALLAEQEAVQFVHMVPRVERPAPPRPQAERSDLDRRATTPELAPDPSNAVPLSRGDTPEKVVGSREEKMAGPETPTPSSAAAPNIAAKVTPAGPAIAQQPAGGSLGSALKNLQRYLQDQNFDNQRGAGEQDPDIQFDSKGVEFGPWLRRFVAQVKRNWYVPQAAMTLRGRVVIQFFVLRNGTITDLRVVQASGVEAFNISAFNALKMSNPTMVLPPEYPDDRAFFTVTFHYNDGYGR